MPHRGAPLMIRHPVWFVPLPVTANLALWLQPYQIEMVRRRRALLTAMLLLGLVFSLLGVSLGSPAGELRARFGDPLLVERTTDLSRTADYLRSDDPSAVLRVTERDGVVFAIEV